MSHYVPSDLFESLNLPRQDLGKLSFCRSNKAKDFENWLSGLKATQIKQTSGQLYMAVPELSRLKVDFSTRLEMLEAARPLVQNSINALTRCFLHQPLILPVEAQKTAAVAQALQKSMIDGYTTAIIGLSQRAKANQKSLDCLALALHRAITGIGLLFLRNYQMYTQIPAGFWKHLHVLFLTAEFYELTDTPIKDPLLNFVPLQTIKHAYIRILALASARCNQISQNDTQALYIALEDWSKHIKLSLGDGQRENAISVNALQDLPPRYHSYQQQAQSEQQEAIYSLNFDGLNKLLEQSLGQSEDIVDGLSRLRTPTDFPESLFKHVYACWSTKTSRELERKNVESTAEVAVGFVDCHYYLCNGQEFNYFVKNSGQGDYEPNIPSFIPRALNVDAEAKTKSAERPVYRVGIQNVSANGYCILWKGDMPVRLEAGELIGIKEIGKRTWSVGAVRWIKQLKQASQMGIQILSSTPKPYGIAQIYDMGGYSDYSRAIYLPSSRFDNGAMSILAPAVPFSEFDKVRILDGDQEWQAKLGRTHFSSGNIKQFVFQPAEQGNNEIDHSSESNSKENFDSGWE